MQQLYGDVRVVPSSEFDASDALVLPGNQLRFPAIWRSSPTQNRYSKAIERGTLSWLESHGIGCDRSEREKLRKFECGRYGGCSLPLAPFSAALLVTQFISLWLFWDDAQVEDDVSWSVDDVVAALTTDPVRTPQSRYVAAWADLGARLRRTTSEAWQRRLGQTMREWLDNAKLETAMARAFRGSRVSPQFDALLECRTISIGMFPTFSLLEFAEGIELSDEFHEHPAIQDLKRSASRLVGLGNDLGGVAKDISQGWLNLVLVLAERSALPLERAFSQVVALHNQEVLAFDRAAASLPRFAPAIEPFVDGWVQAVRYNVRGFALWESVAERYQEYTAIVGRTALLATVVDESEGVAGHELLTHTQPRC